MYEHKKAILNGEYEEDSFDRGEVEQEPGESWRDACIRRDNEFNKKLTEKYGEDCDDNNYEIHHKFSIAGAELFDIFLRQNNLWPEMILVEVENNPKYKQLAPEAAEKINPVLLLLKDTFQVEPFVGTAANSSAYEWEYSVRTGKNIWEDEEEQEKQWNEAIFYFSTKNAPDGMVFELSKFGLSDVSD